MGYDFDEFMDGFAWWRVGPEKRATDFDAALYGSLNVAFSESPLSERHWQQVLQAAHVWNAPALVPSLGGAEIGNPVLLASSLDSIVLALQKAVDEVITHNSDFVSYDLEKIVSLYHALALSGGVSDHRAIPLVCHLLLPAAFPGIDSSITPIDDAGQYLNYLVATQTALRTTDPVLIEKLTGIVMVQATKAGGPLPSSGFPAVSKVVQLMELGRAHRGYFEEHRNEALQDFDFGKTLAETGAVLAGVLNHESGTPVLSEATYQRYAKGSRVSFDLRRSPRDTPEEESPSLRAELFTAVNCIEGVAFWLFRANAPRDFLLQTYQTIALLTDEERVLSDSHIDAVIRGLGKVRGFLTPDLDLDRLHADLSMHSAHLYGEYLRSVYPYRIKETQWFDIPSDDDGRTFISFVRELPSLTTDGDVSWVCHLLSPAAFAPLPVGGEHYLGVNSYEEYNARVKDLHTWSRGNEPDFYSATLLVMQYISSGQSLQNLENIESSVVWPLASLAVFHSITGLTHPGLCQALREEGCQPLEGLHHPTKDFLSSMLYVESAYHWSNGWAKSGLRTMLDSIQFGESSATMPRFVVPTELFPPEVTKLYASPKSSPDSWFGMPIRIIRAAATNNNFGRDEEVA